MMHSDAHSRLSPSCETLPPNSDIEYHSMEQIEKDLDKDDSEANMSNWKTLLTAITHLILFKYLDGALADGPDEKAPQTYINTASQLLANAFQIFLQASLSTSFVQYLWFTLRRSTLRVSTIDTLFLIRFEPLSFRFSAFRAAPQLVCLVLLIWAVYIAAIFPPGALTVGLAPRVTNSLMPVPTFNASYIGNGSIDDANKYGLDTLIRGGNEETPPLSYITSASLLIGQFSSYLQHLANQVVVNGEAFAIPSPCGANCSYTTTFDGPYFVCNTSSANVTFSDLRASSWPTTIYNGTYHFTSSIFHTIDKNEPEFYDSNAVFLTTLLSPVALAIDGNMFIATQHNLTCLPYRAQYTLFNKYENSVPSTNVSTIPIEPVVSFNLEGNAALLLTPDINDIGLTNALNWTRAGLLRYRDLNLVNIVDVIATALVGEYTPSGIGVTSGYNTTLPGYGDILYYLNPIWSTMYNEAYGHPASSSDPNNPIGSSSAFLAESKLNDAVRLGRVQKTDTDTTSISFTITQGLLNELLINATLSIITSYGQWNTTANVTVETFVSTYNFSSPINLILPYFLCLLVALPFILLSLHALHNNGFSTNESGFIQLITTARSASLERVASGRLGSAIPQNLKDLKIRFGELVHRQDKVQRYHGVKLARRVGFGTEDETLPLEKRPTSVDARVEWF